MIVQVLLLDNNLLLYLPPVLSLVRTLDIVLWRGNALSFPPSEILDQGWKVVKPFLHQFCDRTSKTYQAQAGRNKILDEAERRKLDRARHTSSSSEENTSRDEEQRRWSQLLNLLDCFLKKSFLLIYRDL